MAKIIIDYEKCEGSDCAECADVCPMENFKIEGKKVIVCNEEDCGLCEVCMDVCPNEAVTVEED